MRVRLGPPAASGQYTGRRVVLPSGRSMGRESAMILS
jgi:hypothetical protein